MKKNSEQSAVECDGFELIREASKNLNSTSDTPFLDAELLFCFVAGISREVIVSRGIFVWKREIVDSYFELVRRRQTGEPVSYITGSREFYGYNFFVNGSVLIPRPDTELLVQKGLEEISKRGRRDLRILDLGTGSGCVAISIYLEQAKIGCSCSVIAVDKSTEALEVARRNSSSLASNIELMESDWFSNLVGRRFDIIVCNPPYVSPGDERLDTHVKNFEPASALFANENGLSAYRLILENSREHLEDGGVILFEVGEGQADLVSELGMQHLGGRVEKFCDLSGKERVVKFNLV